nr:type IV pilus modification protein PilV [Halomonas sp. 1513]
MSKAMSKGFTLIEALIALLVLSIGMLGVAAMQLNALQGAHAAYQRSIASLAAQDAQERLWASMSDLQCPDQSIVNGIGGEWHSQWSEYLPGLSESPVGPPSDCEFIITIAWDEERFEEDGRESFSYVVRLPVADNGEDNEGL